MAQNGISTLASKQAKQAAKLARATLDITQLPTQYSGNAIVDNPNGGGLITGRPWI